MALSSMTGFARGHGVHGSYAWAWEAKSVNGKGLDLRLRLPPGWDAIEAAVRAHAAEKLARGSVQANLTVERTGILPTVRVNAAVLEAVLTTVRQLASRVEASPPSLDGLLALKGVMEIGEADESEAERRAAETAVIAGFAAAIAALAEMRRQEGATLGDVLETAACRHCRADQAGGACAGPPARGDTSANRRAGGDAAIAVRALRSGPAASGSDPDRGQGRYP